MALTVTQAGSANSTTSSATLTITPTVTFSPGDLIVVVVAADNAGAAGISSTSSVTDNESHTYTNRVNQNRTPGGVAGDGATLTMWTATIGANGLDGSDTVTVNFSPNTTSKAALLWRVQGSLAVPRYNDAGGGVGLNPVVVTTGTLVSGDLVVGATAREGAQVLNADTDTLNGNWSALYTAVANTGTTATSMRLGSQTKIVTGTDAQSYSNGGSSNDAAAGYVVIREASVVTATAVGTWGAWSATATGAVVFVVPDGPYAVTARVDGSSTVRPTDDGQTAVTPRTDGATTTRPTDDGATAVAARIDGSTTAREAP